MSFFRAGPGGSLRLIYVIFNEIVYPDDKSQVPLIPSYNRNHRMKINQERMSSIVSYFHNILGREEAEQKLVADGINKTYLGRRSPLNGDYYILSYQVNQVFKHEIVNAKPVSRGSVELENVLDVLKEMVESNINCEHAVPSILTHSQGGTQGEVGEAKHVHLPEAEEIEVADGEP